MKTARTWGLGVALAARTIGTVAAWSVPVLAAGAVLVACEDEKDPKTWAKRLDDPAQRSTAVRRLSDSFEAAMGNANKNREDEKVKALFDVAVEPLTKTYTNGGLDEKTRKELIKLLADMGDARATPAFAKAFNDFEAGKTDEDLRWAALATQRLAGAGQLQDQALVDALWACFSKFQPSKNNKSINLVKDLVNAVLAVKHPSYGPKAVEKLSTPVNPKDREQSLDHIQFWMSTSVRVIGELKFTPAIKPLVVALMTPSKRDLVFPIRVALQRMAKEAEPVLVAGMKGTDPDLAKLAGEYPENGHLILLGEVVAYISRPAGRDAILDALSATQNDQVRTILATYLTHFPAEQKTQKAYLDTYAKIPPTTAVSLMGGGNGKAILAQASANFFDPTMVDWLLKETAAAKGDLADSMPPAALPTAIKLMTPASKKAVGEAVDKIPGKAIEKEMFKTAEAVLDKCKEDVACYLAALDTTVPTTPPAAKFGHVKAAWMTCIYGGGDKANDTRAKLVDKVEKITDGSVRLAIVEAIDHLAPNGDAPAGEKLDKLVETERAAGKNFAADEVFKVALKLKSRAP
ncbi:MAG: hypothetical protein KC657_10510 [Myxococcales bacterium]|nr:hypothetical protein [Myxococcales bacterium]